MKLSRRQAVALQRSTATINLWYGSVRSSKTHASIWDFIRVMQQRARGELPTEGSVVIVGFSTNTVWRNIFTPLLTHPEFAHVAPHIQYRRNAPSGTMFGQEFSVVGASNESSWLNIQGLTIIYALGDEATGWAESFWNMLVSRLSMPESRLLATCNPGSASHYLKTNVIDKASTDPDIHVEKFLLEQNPTLPRKVVDRMARMYSGLFYRRMILAEWCAAEGAVYETWDQDRMVQSRKPGEVVAVGIDYGTNHPSAGHALTITEDGLQLTHEWSPQVNSMGGRSRLTDKELADSLERWLATLPNQPRAIYADPAAASFHEELRRRGIRTAKADNHVVDGIRTVESLLTSGMLTITPECKQLIQEIPGYRWDPKATERGKDAPVKEKDDYCDAMRYTVFSSRGYWFRHVEQLRRAES